MTEYKPGLRGVRIEYDDRPSLWISREMLEDLEKAKEALELLERAKLIAKGFIVLTGGKL